jgi:secondary thiamine-phosphate synthase enzyme
MEGGLREGTEMERITVRTSKRLEMIDITEQVGQALARLGIERGGCVVYVPHTTAGVTVNEGADPDVCRDILEHLSRLVPNKGDYHHGEGNSDSHILTSLVGSSQFLLVEGGRIALGTWQRVFLCEFDGPRIRNVWVQSLAG